jgi:hypothetical protein
MMLARQSSMLVIDTHHRAINDDGLVGSIAQEALRGGACPVVVVPAARRNGDML